MAKHRRRHRAKIAAGCLAAIGAFSLATIQLVTDDGDRRDQVRVIGDPTTTLPPTTTPATNPDADRLAAAEAAWDDFVDTLPVGTVPSPVAMSTEGPVAVTGNGEPRLVLYRFAEQWREIERFETPLSLSYGPGGDGHFTLADVTDDGQDEFLVLDYAGADHRGGSVLSEHGGRWHLVAFAARTYLERDYLRWERSTYITWLGLEDAAARSRYGSVLNTRSNDCTPSCADGTLHQDHWRFDAGTGDFESVAHHVWPETVPDRLFAAWQQGDRVAASEVATSHAVDALFAHDPYEAEWNLYGACREPVTVATFPTCTAYTHPGSSLELITDLVASTPRVIEVRFLED